MAEADDDAILRRLEPVQRDFYRSLHDAADEAVVYAQTPHRRIYMGIPELDEQMRGTAPKFVTMVFGYSGNSKTVLITNMVASNPDRHLLWATPDESELAVLTKLTAVRCGVSWPQMEAMLQSGDPSLERAARDMLHETADRFPNLFVCAQSLSTFTMSQAIGEYQDETGQQIEGVIFDYADLFEAEGDTIARLKALKMWCVHNETPMFIIHQTSRTAGVNGEPLHIGSAAFGGEAIATHMIGIRRQKNYFEHLIAQGRHKLHQIKDPHTRADLEDQISEWLASLAAHENRVSIGLYKNKVPPMQTVPEFDMILEPGTGRLLPLDSDVTVETRQSIKSLAFGGH